MMPNDPFHHQHTEYWAHRTADYTRHGYSTRHLRIADFMWHAMENMVKYATFPIWWPIVAWNRRKKRKKQPVDPFATDINRPTYR
ncbi:MAG: hypothetical protein OYI31_07025 [Chloroflexota bacterium]|nr:hypothetical protein [Chloroflexota bacterium]MDE2941201.1 hypothetical protein [Chloroflexota bacterium]MDE3268179.1 hypothetical protein [Chloroflexota bacterium]